MIGKVILVCTLPLALLMTGQDVEAQSAQQAAENGRIVGTWKEPNTNSTFRFQPDGTYEDTTVTEFGSGKETGTYSIDGDVLTLHRMQETIYPPPGEGSVHTNRLGTTRTWQVQMPDPQTLVLDGLFAYRRVR